MPHLSFRFTLLASFLFLAGMLGAIAASGWWSLTAFADRGRSAARNAIDLTTALQQLGERTVDLERSARQFLVLRDPRLQDRHADARAGALDALARLDLALPSAAGLTAEWRRVSDFSFDGDAAGASAPEPAAIATAVAARLQQLRALNDRLASRITSAIDEANAAQLDALDRQRERLATQLLAGLALAAALGLLIGWWILRPLRQLAGAISALGEDRLNTAVAVGGPADLRRLGERLDWLRLRLADLEANRNRVLRHVSHELKTPLASLREGVALLIDGVTGKLNDGQREVATILAGNVRTLQERIEQLLDYNASQFNAGRLALKPTALGELAAAVIDEFRLPAQGKGVRLHLDGDAPALALDPDKMRIVISNLLNNAIAFSPPGGEVGLVLGCTAEAVTLDCIDDGPGVSPADAERIFDPFVRGTNAAHASQGSGLGLAIVREFVRAHGGRIGLQPSARGAHFRVELPHG